MFGFLNASSRLSVLAGVGFGDSELKAQGLEVDLVTIGNKATGFFKARNKVRRSFTMGGSPSADTASAIADELLSEYLSGEVDRVEFCYTRFINLITSEPSIRTMLPLKASGKTPPSLPLVG